MSGTGTWKAGLLDCCGGGCGTCMYGFCCPNCAAAGARRDFDGSNCCFNLCCVGLTGNYNIVREGSGIDGSCFGDVLKSLCCSCCMATQMLQQPSDRTQWKKSGSGRWQHGLFDLCAAGCGTGCWACLCSGCVAAQARTNFDSSNCCFNLCCLTPCANYNIIREGSGIEGDCVGDVLKACFCPCCSAVQMYSQAPH